MTRQHFYKDQKGELQQYVHCVRGCPENYTQDQIGTDIIKVTDHSSICMRCCKELNIKDKFFLDKTIKLEEDDDFVIPHKSLKSIETVIDEDLEKPAIVENKLYVYVVKCNDETFYVAVTKDIGKAIKNHNRCCGSDYTREKGRRPVKLVVSKETNSMEEAKKIKSDLKKEYKVAENSN